MESQWEKEVSLKIIKSVMMIFAAIVILGALLPALWPLLEDTLTNIANMSGGESTEMLQVVWPIVLILLGLAVGIGLILWALRILGVFGGKRD